MDIILTEINWFAIPFVLFCVLNILVVLGLFLYEPKDRAKQNERWNNVFGLSKTLVDVFIGVIAVDIVVLALVELGMMEMMHWHIAMTVSLNFGWMWLVFLVGHHVSNLLKKDKA